MKILYVSDIDISLPDGPGVNEREFVWTLQNQSEIRGDEAFFIIPRPSRRLDFTLRNAVFCQNNLKKKASLPGWKSLSTTWHLLIPILRRVFDTDIDLVVTRINRRSVLLPLALTLLGQKYAIKTLGNTYRFFSEGRSAYDKAVLLIFRSLLGLGLRNALFIDVCTPEFFNNYRTKYGLKDIQVIENSVNTERFFVVDREYSKNRCGLEMFQKIVGYCGGHPSWRGARQLVEISPRMVSKYPDCGILIVGDDSELGSLKEKARELGTRDHVIFKGIVDYEEVLYYINCLDVGVALPVAQDKVRLCGNSSQKIRQYLACGVPIICPWGTNRTIVNEGLGVAVPSNDLARIFDAICFWLDRSYEEKELFRQTAHLYAKESLSVIVAYEKRYFSWKERIERKKNGN